MVRIITSLRKDHNMNVMKTVLLASVVMILSMITVSAEWQFVGYDTTDLSDVKKIYRENLEGNDTGIIKTELVDPFDIVWLEEGYEASYPHKGYSRLYIEGIKQEKTHYNGLMPQWETRFADYFWDFLGSHRIYQRQQTYIPEIGWVWDFGNNAETDKKLLIDSGRDAEILTEFLPFSFASFDLNGNYLSDDVFQMYKRFNLNPLENVTIDGKEYTRFKVEGNTKEIERGDFFHYENLSAKDPKGKYLWSDEKLAEYISSFVAKRVIGPSFSGDMITKNIAEEYLRHKDTDWNWDSDLVKPGGGHVSWTEGIFQKTDPFLEYQYMIANGVVLDGHNDTPCVYRLTGGKAAPALPPAQEVEAPAIVLMYHRLTQDSDSVSAYNILQSDFEADVKYLLEAGYTFCTASELAAYIKNADFTEKRVALTFDDGYDSDYSLALPILEKYHVKATFFVIGSKVDYAGHTTRDEIAKMASTGLAEIGNHTYDLHYMQFSQLYDLYFRSADMTPVYSDIQKNNTLIEEITGTPVKSFSFPFGLYSGQINDYMTYNGFATFSSVENILTYPTSPMYRVNRPCDRTAEEIIQSKIGE